MLLNTAKFSEYVNTFNKCMHIVSQYYKHDVNDIFVYGVKYNNIDQLIYNIFPRDWIIYGMFYDKYRQEYVTKYHNIRDLSYMNLQNLQTSINNIEIMLDNSIQSLADFDENFKDLGNGI